MNYYDRDNERYYQRGSGYNANDMFGSTIVSDAGPNPYVVNIRNITLRNNTFRTVVWTGEHLQLTVMSIPVGESIGLENHTEEDQFIRIERGRGVVKMGKDKERPSFQQNLTDGSAILIPANTWHNIINTGNMPLKLYSIYAPPHHYWGTVHNTKADALANEHH